MSLRQVGRVMFWHISKSVASYYLLDRQSTDEPTSFSMMNKKLLLLLFFNVLITMFIKISIYKEASLLPFLVSTFCFKTCLTVTCVASSHPDMCFNINFILHFILFRVSAMVLIGMVLHQMET